MIMKFYAISVLFFVCLVAAVSAATTYTPKYDNIDIDEILNNDRLYKKYFDCLVNKGKCTTEGRELKEILPEVLATGCKKCTEKQKSFAEITVKFLLEKKPQDYAVLEKIYDPEGVYKKKYAAEAAKRGIII